MHSRAANIQSFDFLTEDILMYLCAFLNTNQKLALRASSTRLNEIVSYRGSWDGNNNKNEIVDFAALAASRKMKYELKLKLNNLEYTDNEYREVFYDIQVSKGLLDDRAYKELQDLVDEKREHTAKNMFKGCNFNVVSPVLFGLSLIGIGVISAVFATTASAETTANRDICKEIYFLDTCKTNLRDSFNIALAFYFILGGTISSLIKLVEWFYIPEIENKMTDLLLPPSLAVDINSLSSKALTVFGKVLEYRDYIALMLACALMASLIVANPGGYNPNKFVFNEKIDHASLKADVAYVSNLIKGLGPVEGFLLAYSFFSTLGLLCIVPKKLYSNCSGFFYKQPKTPIERDEESKLIVTYRKTYTMNSI